MKRKDRNITECADIVILEFRAYCLSTIFDNWNTCFPESIYMGRHPIHVRNNNSLSILVDFLFYVIVVDIEIVVVYIGKHWACTAK